VRNRRGIGACNVMRYGPSRAAGPARYAVIVALAALAGGCSCDPNDPWRAVTYIDDAEAATSPPAPNCEAAAKAAAKVTAGAAPDAVDPDLIEIARLEIERDCYRDAAANARRQLQALQDTSVTLK